MDLTVSDVECLLHLRLISILLGIGLLRHALTGSLLARFLRIYFLLPKRRLVVRCRSMTLLIPIPDLDNPISYVNYYIDNWYSIDNK